jgi:hypothetical protein
MYRMSDFGGIALPSLNPKEFHDAPPSGPGLTRSIGGSFDYYGTAQSTAIGQTLTHVATYVGEDANLIDEDGNFLVDELGNNILGGYACDDLQTQVSALRALIRTSNRLVRRRLSDGWREWKQARLLSLRHPANFSEGVRAEITSAFELVDDGWHSELLSVYTRAVPSDTTTNLFVQNGSNITVNDAVLTITRQSGTITSVVIATNTGISINWLGSMATGALVIDAGQSTVRLNGVSAYNANFLGIGHTARGWLPLLPGPTTLAITLTGGSATARIEFYEQTA